MPCSSLDAREPWIEPIDGTLRYHLRAASLLQTSIAMVVPTWFDGLCSEQRPSTVHSATNHWLTVQLRQPEQNVFGIGAKVTVVTGDDRQTRWLSAGGTGLAGSAPPDLLFGLGTRTDVDRIEVLWPDGTRSTHTDVSVDRHTTIKRLSTR